MVVVIVIELLTVVEPTRFPSPANGPPILIPDPNVSIPMNTLDALDAVGTQEILIAAIVFPLMNVAGVALVVVT